MSLDAVMGRAAQWAAGGAVVAASLFLVEEPTDLLVVSLVHLAGLVIFGFLFAIVVAPATDVLGDGTVTSTGTRFARAASVVVIVTGTTVVVTIVASTAIGFEVSLQFLQVLSALDIAWVVAATYFGLRWRFGQIAGLGGGTAIGIVCVWSIWRYLDRVGFTESGGWLVDTDALTRLVYPLDAMAAAIAVGLLWWGARHATEQRSPQS